MPNIILISRDGVRFEVDYEIVKRWGTMTKLKKLDIEYEEVIPLPKINSAILRQVILWAIYHKYDSPPPADEDHHSKERRLDVISQWDADFLKVCQRTLVDLFWAADYLNIQGLMDVCWKPVNMLFSLKCRRNPEHC